MLEALLPCELVISSSLHGLIFAEAFGIPARWLAPRDVAHLEHSSYVTEGWFKYVDYYASTRPEVRAKVEARATSYDGTPTTPDEWPTALLEDMGALRPGPQPQPQPQPLTPLPGALPHRLAAHPHHPRTRPQDGKR